MFYLTQSIHRNAQIYPKKIATIAGDREQNWKQVKDRVARFGAALTALNVKGGDRVAMLALNSDRYLECFYSIPWAGAIFVPMNIRWSAPENAYSLNDCGAEILIVDDAFAKMIPALKQAGVNLREIIFIGDGPTPDEMKNYEELISKHQPVEDVYRTNDDIAAIYYTGGTTGFPKGVMLSHTNIWSSTSSTCGILNITKESKVLHAAPMFHIAASAMTQCAVMVGAVSVTIPMFTPEATVAALEQHKITNVLLVPVMIQMTINAPSFKEADFSHLKYLAYGASPISEALLVQAMEDLPDTQFMQAYGQTELAPIATLLGAEYHTTQGPYAGKLRSAGQAVTCTEVRVVDTEGNEVTTGEIGEIIVKGPNAMVGYWNKPKQTAKTLRNGWVHTGDAGYMDEEGFVFLVDRVKDMIVSGGENVYSAEVENAVMNHPAVDQVVVIGIPSEKWGEQVHAEIILKEGASPTEEEIIKTAHNYIANYKCPRSIQFRTKPFPLSGAGKILKREVRKSYWEGVERMIN